MHENEKGEAYENSTSRERCAVAWSGVEAIAMRLDPAGCDCSRRSSVGGNGIWQTGSDNGGRSDTGAAYH